MGAQAGSRLFMADHDLHGLSLGQLASAHRAVGEAAPGGQARRPDPLRAARRGPAQPKCATLPDRPWSGACTKSAQYPVVRMVAVASSLSSGSGRMAGYEKGLSDD